MKMLLSKRITDQLQNVPFRQGGEIQAVEGNLRVEIKLSDWDRLGCLLKRICIARSQGDPLALDPARIEDRITYLGERLDIIERDGVGGRSILRSAPPRIDGEVISFFEMVLDKAKGLSLMRYQYDRRQGERTPVPASLTRDVLERLVADLIGLIEEN